MDTPVSFVSTQTSLNKPCDISKGRNVTTSSTNFYKSQSRPGYEFQPNNFHQCPVTTSNTSVIPDLLRLPNLYNPANFNDQNQQYKPSLHYLHSHQEPSQNYNANNKSESADSRWPRNFQSPGEHVSQLQIIQQQLEPIKKPWWLWCIAVIDILYAVVWTIRLVYSTFTESFSEPDAFVWRYFLGSIDTLLILSMGIGLLAGLRSEDDTSTLWYCKMWVVCQLLFLLGSTIQGFVVATLYAAGSARTNTLLFWLLRFSYGLASFLLVKVFIEKLKQNERFIEEHIGGASLVERGDGDLERQVDYNNENNGSKQFGTGESWYYVPAVASIMSMQN